MRSDPEPIFTPATKAVEGHDENISFERAAAETGAELMGWLRDRPGDLQPGGGVRVGAWDHHRGHKVRVRAAAGEDGEPLGGEPILIDEALTPDSSRFWPADGLHAPGRSQASFDKQFVREYLEGLVSRGQWDKTARGRSCRRR